VIRYLRNEIGYKSDFYYQGPFGGGYPPPTSFRGDWMSVRWNRTAEPNASEALRAAMKSNPRLNVFIACGIYDLVCPYYANEHAAANLPADLTGRVIARSYGGGHAIYTDDAARLQLKRDVAAFISERVTAMRRAP
jgi:carboxypeptidase C (cathepsin A)